MKNPSFKLSWIPRILSMAAIALVSLFALDAFEPGQPFGKQVLAFGIHLIPSLILVFLLLIAWRNELIGGIAFTLIGVVFTPPVFFHNYQMNHSIGVSLGVVAMITFPFIVVGVLFLISFFRNRKKGI